MVLFNRSIYWIIISFAAKILVHLLNKVNGDNKDLGNIEEVGGLTFDIVIPLIGAMLLIDSTSKKHVELKSRISLRPRLNETTSPVLWFFGFSPL